MKRTLFATIAFLLLLASSLAAQPANVWQQTTSSGVFVAGDSVDPRYNYTANIGNEFKKWLAIYAAELRVETLVAQDTIATIGGRIVVGPTTTLTQDITAGSTTIYVKHNEMQPGDQALMEGGGYFEVIRIDAGPTIQPAGDYAYTVTRDRDGSGASAWTAGSALFNTGAVGDGFVDLYSFHGVKTPSEVGPSVVGNVRTSPSAVGWEPRWALGNLNGLYGTVGNIYGAAFGATGSTRLTIDASSGIRMFNSANALMLDIDMSGNATFAGAVTIGTARNWFTNSEFRSGLEEMAGRGTTWFQGYNTTGFTPELGVSYSPTWTLDGGGTAYTRILGYPANGTLNMVYSPLLAIETGKSYEFSAYVGNHRTHEIYAGLLWFDGAFALLSSNYGTSRICTVASPGGQFVDGYCRIGVIAAAPANARFAVAVIRSDFDGTEGGDPYCFWTRVLFSEARTGQTQLSEWGPGGVTQITGNTIKTGTISLSHLNFTPVQTSNVVASINATAEGIRIAGNRINIDGNVTFAAGYDPTGKIASGGAATDVNNNVTTISGGKITTGSVTATQLSADAIDGKTITGATIRTAAAGARVEMNGTNLRSTDGSSDLVSLDGDGIRVMVTSSPSMKYSYGFNGRYAGMGYYDTGGLRRLQLFSDEAVNIEGRDRNTGATTWGWGFEGPGWGGATSTLVPGGASGYNIGSTTWPIGRIYANGYSANAGISGWLDGQSTGQVCTESSMFNFEFVNGIAVTAQCSGEPLPGRPTLKSLAQELELLKQQVAALVAVQGGGQK